MGYCYQKKMILKITSVLVSSRRIQARHKDSIKVTVVSLAFLGWAEGPEASTETRTPDL
jgi:hypothetical protein